VRKISNLFGFYEREYNSDILALINTAKRISGKQNLMIKFNTRNSAVFTDGHCIHLPQFCKDKIKPAQGFVAHESGHIGYGSFELGFLQLVRRISDKYKIPIPIVKELTNVLEDVRVNSINKKEFPGFYKNLRDYTLELLPILNPRIKHSEDLFLYLNLYMEDFPGFDQKPDFASIRLTSKEWETISLLKSFLLKALTPNATIIALNQICKILKKYFLLKEKKRKTRNNNKIPKRIIVVDKPVGSTGFSFKESYSRNEEIIVLTAIEDFTDKKIEENPTAISKASDEMLKKIDKMDLSNEDIKELSSQIEEINKEKGKEEAKKIAEAIGGKVKQISAKINRKDNALEKIIDTVEDLMDTDKPPTEKDKEEIIHKLQKYSQEKQKKSEQEIRKEKECLEQIDELVNDFEELSKCSTTDEKKQKKAVIRKKIKSYIEKSAEKSGSQKGIKKDETKDLFGDIFKNLNEEKNYLENKDEQTKLIDNLKKTRNQKEKEIKTKERKFVDESNEMTEIINELENLDYKSPASAIKKQKDNILSQLKDYNDHIKNSDDDNKIKIEFGEKNSENDSYDLINKELLGELVIDINEAKNELKKRIAKIGMGKWALRPALSDINRKVIETRIEKDKMDPIRLSYDKIIDRYSSIIKKMKFVFKNLKPNSEFDNYQKKGRLNKNFIKTITSNYQFKNCFTRKIHEKRLRIVLLVDISGSMKGKKLQAAKVAMVMFAESLQEIAETRIVLFTGNSDARNILVKNFHESIDPKKFDKVGCHMDDKSNLDGLSLQREASKLHNNELFIVISDGKPAGRRYGINQAMHQVQKVRKQFKVYAFSIDANGDHLNKMYDKNWILAKSHNRMDLSQKIMQFSRLVVNEFY
jgi:uncharacterized protein YegL